MSISTLQLRGEPPLRRRRSQGERSAETSSALIEAAIACLCELGYARTTTSEIARRATCTTGAMQHHFGSKEELLVAVLQQLSEEFRSRYASFEALARLPVPDRCRFILDGLWEYYNSSRYMAIWELYVGTRSEPELNALCVRSREKSIAACERAWTAAFADVGGEHQRLVDIMLLAMSLVRSIGLNNALHPQPEAYRRQLALLQKFMTSEIADIAASADQGNRPEKG